jgi:hypothetical protein
VPPPPVLEIEKSRLGLGDLLEGLQLVAQQLVGEEIRLLEELQPF